jgi:hypothetical protein
MARNPSSFAKRQRELARQQKRKEKALRQKERRMRKQTSPDGDSADGIDPDIAGIVPGPQPLPWADEEADSSDDDE